MTAKGQLTGMTGVFLVSAELALGWPKKGGV